MLCRCTLMCPVVQEIACISFCVSMGCAINQGVFNVLVRRVFVLRPGTKKLAKVIGRVVGIKSCANIWTSMFKISIEPRKLCLFLFDRGHF